MIKRAVSVKELERELKEIGNDITATVVIVEGRVVKKTVINSIYRLNKEQRELKNKEIEAVEFLESLGYSLFR